MNEEEVYINYIIALHELATELKIKTEYFTTDKKLTDIILKASRASLNKDDKKVEEYEQKARDRIEEIKKSIKKINL